MPLFFYCSGRGSAFNKDKFLMFCKKKVLRLLVPLVFGITVFVIPATYIGRVHRPAIMNIENIEDKSIGYFYARFFTEFGDKGFDWYWFLPVLFAIQIVNYHYLESLK